MEAMSIEELKGEKCPRISAEDLIELGELLGCASSRSPTKRRFNSKPMIVILDVRHYDEYPFKGFFKNVSHFIKYSLTIHLS